MKIPQKESTYCSLKEKRVSYDTPTSPERPPLHNGHFVLSPIHGGRFGEVRQYVIYLVGSTPCFQRIFKRMVRDKPVRLDTVELFGVQFGSAAMQITGQNLFGVVPRIFRHLSYIKHS